MPGRRVQLAAGVAGLVAALLVGVAMRGTPARAQVICLGDPVCITSVPTGPPGQPTTTTTTAPPGRTPPPGGPTGPTSDAITGRVDAGRGAWVPGDTLVPPLVPIWSRRFPGPVFDHPIVAQGMVFVAVTVQSADGTLSTRVVALDAPTGRRRWARARPSGGWLGYGAGLLVSSWYDSSQELDAATGAVRWSGPGLEGAPLVTGGAVYASNMALDAATGKSIWDRGSAEPGNVAADASSLYVPSSTCVSRLNRENGLSSWPGGSTCQGSTSGGESLAPGRVLGFSGYDLTLLDAANGHEITSYPETTAPVVVGDQVVGMSGGDPNGEPRMLLTARRVGDGRLVWRRTVGRVRSGALDVDAYGAGRWIYAMRGSFVQARASADGRAAWGTRFPVRSPPTDDHGGRQGFALGAGPAILLTVGGRQVTAYTSLFAPAPHAVDALPVLLYRFYGQRTRVLGRVGTALAGNKARLMRGGRSLDVARSRPDGFLALHARLGRNARLRVAVGKVRSRGFHVFVYPRERLRSKRLSPHRVQVTAMLAGPRRVRLAGRHVVLYLARVHKRRYVRLARAVLVAAGHGRARARFVFPPVPFVGPRDFALTCVPGLARAGMGDIRVRLSRRCGARRIRF